MQRFSERHPPTEPPITVRDDAPEAFRRWLVRIAWKYLDAGRMRDAVCDVLLVSPDPDNWSGDRMAHEVGTLVNDCHWTLVYDAVEAIHAAIAHQDARRSREPPKNREFEADVNRLLARDGIGYALRDGRVVLRGAEAFERTPKQAILELRAAGKPTSAAEVEQAMEDISRRPADLTGAVHHAMNALECLAKSVVGSQGATLGQISGRLDLPKPLDAAVDKLWGYASQAGRHVSEGKEPTFEDAEFVVTIAAGLCTYLVRRQGKG